MNPLQYLPSGELLGGDVVVSFDGQDIILRTFHGDEVTNKITLNPQAIETLQRYLKRIDAMTQDETEAGLQGSAAEPRI